MKNQQNSFREVTEYFFGRATIVLFAGIILIIIFGDKPLSVNKTAITFLTLCAVICALIAGYLNSREKPPEQRTDPVLEKLLKEKNIYKHEP